MKSVAKVEVRDERALASLVDRGAKLVGRRDKIEERLRKVREQITQRAKEDRKPDEKSVVILGKRARAVVVFGERVSWDADALRELEKRDAKEVDRLFVREVVYTPKPELAKFIEDDDPVNGELQREVLRARQTQEISPAVRFIVRG